ncbi:SGNH/GDSL hydrolase family protein [Alteromonas sp. MMG017]|uniref:SGNH/GDSL hydrolase family protein n=1 Tax=Alteromonas sp. MMG017 TaxID=2822692 RepID=UPI001B3A2A73|nr:SGNH/GDSL hydrolase family protein [Alteromonas sp. MMG017]MBQ4830034.1 SGNH/GDSL hydrolase family protein [Alteromonas sp. MMG017]
MKKNYGVSVYQLIVGLLCVLLLEPVLASNLPSHFVTSWTSSPQPIWGDDFIFPTNIPAKLENKTIRQSVRVSLGGDSFRIEMSNAYGSIPVKLGRVTVGLPVSERDNYVLEQTISVTFGGAIEATIQPGAVLLSDIIPLQILPLSSIVISVYLPERTELGAFHWDGRQTNFIVSGDQSQASVLSSKRYETTARLLISALFVENEGGSAIAVIGDSITDGATASLDNNARWTDFLAERLKWQNTAVFNAGISGARLLSDGMGSNALSRLNRDVISKPGLKSLIVLLGINDIAWPGTLFAPSSERPSLNKLIAGFTQLAEQTHLHGVKIYVATLPPFEGALSDTALSDYYSEEKNALRLALNNWIRGADVFDDVIDFDRILQSENNPNKIGKEFDSGDHLHPSDAGNKAMAYGIDLTIFTNQIGLKLAEEGAKE